MKKSVERWILGLALGLCTASAAPPAHADQKVSDNARAYFKNGVDLLKSDPPNYQDAYYQFKLAYEKSHSWKVLGNLGLCAVKLERDAEALDYYENYLRSGGKQISKEERTEIENDMLLIKGNDATVELSSKLLELNLVDTRSGSSAPPQSYAFGEGRVTLTLRAGAHRLMATAQDGRSLTWDVTMEPGQSASHEFDFDAPLTPPPAAPAPPPAKPADVAPPVETKSNSSASVRTVGFVTAGVGLLALGGGVVTGVMSKSKESNAKSKCDDSHQCYPEAQPPVSLRPSARSGHEHPADQRWGVRRCRHFADRARQRVELVRRTSAFLGARPGALGQQQRVDGRRPFLSSACARRG